MSSSISALSVRARLSHHRPVHRAGGRRASVALVLALESESCFLLLIERASHPADPWSGHMAFPGGHQEPDDGDQVATALRELSEEVGLHLDRARDFVACLDDITGSAHGRPLDLIISPVLFAVSARCPLTTNDEVEAALWVDLSLLTDPLARIDHEVSFPEGQVTVPGLVLGNRVVWGLTLRMLDGLLTLLGG